MEVPDLLCSFEGNHRDLEAESALRRRTQQTLDAAQLGGGSPVGKAAPARASNVDISAPPSPAEPPQ